MPEEATSPLPEEARRGAAFGAGRRTPANGWSEAALTVVLLSKPHRRRIRIEADFTGVVVPDRFLVGCGLDCAGRYRQLPCLGILDSG